jgi:colanic acid biosynthesis glycosyl transferase WcaI
VLFPNWVDMAQIQPLQQPSSYRRELGIPDTAVVALYSGNMNLKQGLDILSDCAQRLASDKHIYFVFGGQGPARELLQAACGQLPQVRLLDLQPTERLNDWLGLADIHLLPQRADIADLVMPSKLTGMLASGRPVIATAHAGSALAQALADCGAITPPGDSDALARMVQALAADPEQRKRLGNAARQQAEASLAKISLLTQFQQQLSAMLAINPTF